MSIFKKSEELSMSYFIQPPKTEGYKTILLLLNQAEEWDNKEIRKKIYTMISEKAKEYAESE